MSADLYDIKVFVCKIWESVRNCFRNNIFSSLPPYNADQFARIQGTDDNYMKGYLIKRKYQLFLSQMLQLVMIALYIAANVRAVERGDMQEYMTRKSTTSMYLVDFSIVFIKIIEWIMLSVSLYNANNIKTLVYSHVALFSVFVVRMFYLFLPYYKIVELDLPDRVGKYKEPLSGLFVIAVYLGGILPFMLPNMMLLRACKKATYYLSQHYDTVTKDDYFYYMHFVLSWIYVIFVSIFYGVAWLIIHYVIWVDENLHSLGFDGYVQEEYVPILWMVWFLSAMFELVPRKSKYSCCAELLAFMCNTVWWIIVLVILSYMNLLSSAVRLIFAGYAQYYQLKLQLRDFFVALEYRRRTDTRPHYGGERVVEMLHMDPPTMPMDIQSDASPTAVHIPISAAGYQKVEEAS